MKKTISLIASVLVVLSGIASQASAGTCNAKPKTKIAAVLAKLNDKPSVCRNLQCMKKDFGGIKVTSEQLGKLKGTQVVFRTYLSQNLNPEQLTRFQKAGLMAKDFGGAKVKPEKLDHLKQAQAAFHNYVSRILTFDQMIQVDFKNPEWLTAAKPKGNTCGK